MDTAAKSYGCFINLGAAFGQQIRLGLRSPPLLRQPECRWLLLLRMVFATAT